MAETGIVTRVHGSMLDIEMQRNDACAHCGACISFSNDNTMHLTAENCCEAAIGDTVEITLETSRFLSAVGFLYGIPLVVFMVALFLGYVLKLSEGMTVAVSFAALGAAWTIIHFLSKKLNQSRYTPKAVRVTAHP